MSHWMFTKVGFCCYKNNISFFNCTVEIFEVSKLLFKIVTAVNNYTCKLFLIIIIITCIPFHYYHAILHTFCIFCSQTSNLLFLIVCIFILYYFPNLSIEHRAQLFSSVSIDQNINIIQVCSFNKSNLYNYLYCCLLIYHVFNFIKLK